MQISLNLIVAFFIGLIILVVGNYLGLLEGRGQGYEKRKKEEAAETKTKAGIETPLPAPDPPAMPVESNLLKLSLDKNNQSQLDLYGQRVNISQLTPKQREQLIDLMRTMRSWVEDKVAPAATPQLTARPLAAQTPPLSRPVRTPLAGASVSQPKPSRLATVLIPPLKEAPPPPTSMVAQIDAILQTNLFGTPLENRGIRLNESIQGGVIVIVGTQKYESISDVPEAEILAAIRAAVAEWERTYTPGI